jgi:hypothetical protein
MAGNKFDTQFERVIPKAYKLTYIGLYDNEITVDGDAKQIINHIITQQL